MSKLTSEQLAFLKSQGISLSLVVDAGHLSKSAREAFMGESGQKFYYGGTPCKAAGHTLRSKAGHCIQCDTSKIAYQLRSSASGYVYLAHSERNGFVKIGFSEVDPYNRVTWLQASAYGDVNDWEIKRSVKILKDAGKCEFEIHAALEKWRRPIVYQKNGEAVECREIFACPFKEAEKKVSRYRWHLPIGQSSPLRGKFKFGLPSREAYIQKSLKNAPPYGGSGYLAISQRAVKKSTCRHCRYYLAQRRFHSLCHCP